uniref:Reticulon-like protein n=1 Tax=Kalanchoe fedtschenkoi TaxID=63787 RepID=A0A7N0UX59_KALFE
MATYGETSRRKLFGRDRSIHAALGGGKVADVLLWRDKSVSAGILVGVTVLWFLFEVAEYNLVTLLCHMFITKMLAIFIWGTCAEFFKLSPPKIPLNVLDEQTFQRAAIAIHRKFIALVSLLIYVACGNDLRLFFSAIAILSVLSIVGNYISFINLLFFGFLVMETVPFLYERYEDDVDYIVGKMVRELKENFRRFDSNVLNRIPRGPTKDRKVK